MDPEEAVGLAIEVAEEGLAVGEMPIGAVVLRGDEVIARRHTEEVTQRRRIVHADLLAMQDADRLLGRGPAVGPLVLAVNLEPCLMCLGAAVTMQIDHVWFGLRSPNDGGVDLIRQWSPRQILPFFHPPSDIRGAYAEERVRDQFLRYAVDETRPDGMRDWCAGLGSNEADAGNDGDDPFVAR